MTATGLLLGLHKVRLKTSVLVALLGGLFAAVESLAHATAAFAQTATPVPTPVLLAIPTDVLFTSANNWIATFAPIAAIGIGISIAIAVLGYIGVMIVKGFRG